MPQHKGFEPFSRLWRIEAHWYGIGADLRYHSWVYYEWITSQEWFDYRMSQFAKHPDYQVDGYELDWLNQKEAIVAWFLLQSGPFMLS